MSHTPAGPDVQAGRRPHHWALWHEGGLRRTGSVLWSQPASNPERHQLCRATPGSTECERLHHRAWISAHVYRTNDLDMFILTCQHLYSSNRFSSPMCVARLAILHISEYPHRTLEWLVGIVARRVGLNLGTSVSVPLMPFNLDRSGPDLHVP